MSVMNCQRVLALDIRSRQVGYAVFEGPDVLLDWGIKNFRGGVNAVRVPFEMKLMRLFSDWQPHAVILKGPNNGRVVQNIKVAQARAKSGRIPVHFVKTQAVSEAFPSLGKYEIAKFVSVSFPELAIRLPPKRKVWQSEDYRMSIFDAAALGLAYFRRVEPQSKRSEAA